MAAKRAKKKSTRITVDLSAADYDRLGQMTRATGATTQVAVVRQALGLLDLFVRKGAGGYEFFATKGDERQRIVKV
jgi:hypothetical protein